MTLSRCLLPFLSIYCFSVFAQNGSVKLVDVDSGWANNSINTTVFRKNSLVSFHEWQYIAFYNADGYVVLGKRKVDESKWQLKTTSSKGNVLDAHNVISIMVDGIGSRMAAVMVFRNEERGNKVSAAVNESLGENNWKVIDLLSTSVGSWEPTYDTELWKDKRLLHLFLQKVEQVDAEGKANLPPQVVRVLEWNPQKTN